MKDIHLLSNEDRWMLYKYWLTKSLAALQKEIQERNKCYGKAQEHYKNVQQVADIKILQRAKIIACTTSRAAPFCNAARDFVSQYLYSIHLSSFDNRCISRMPCTFPLDIAVVFFILSCNVCMKYDGEEYDLFEMDENTRDDGDDDSENYDNHFTTRQGKKLLDIDLLHMAVSSFLVEDL
jgi:hypothetical protein